MQAFLNFLLSFSAIEPQECVKIDTAVSGSSMAGLLWEGQALEVWSRGCGAMARYDHAVFLHKDRNGPIIKQIWGMPGDTLAVLPNGQFTINDVVAKTPFGKPYYLLGSARSRFTKLTGKIEGYLLLGHPGSDDSARLGLIAEADILGYVPLQTKD